MRIAAFLAAALLFVGCDGRKESKSQTPATREETDSASTDALARTIRAGRERPTSEVFQAMREFMDRWKPVGKTLDLLEARIGPATSRRVGEARFLLDMGLGGWEWVVALDGSTITKVECLSLE